MQPVVIFGIGELAQLAYFYLTHDSKYTVAAFTVDGSYINDSTYFGMPVIPFELVENCYPPQTFKMLIAVGYAKMNQVRIQKFQMAKEKGYQLISYISSRASTWFDLNLGKNCIIMENNMIQPFVKIGDNVIILPSNSIAHHTEISDHCYIAGHAVIAGKVKVGRGCFIGVNATIRNDVSIGDNCAIGANALILQNTPENGVYKAPAAELSKVPSYRLRKL